MRQVIYISTATVSAAGIRADDILRQSRQNNARDGVTGFLYADGKRFLQALEGEESAVARTIARIAKDPRHRAIVTLSDRIVEHRDFGDWAMAWRNGAADAAAFIDRVAVCIADASPSIRATFSSFAEVRRAA